MVCDSDGFCWCFSAIVHWRQKPSRHWEVIVLRKCIIFVALIAASGLSFAAAPLLKVTKSVMIDASAARVWDRTRDFGGLNMWHPAVDTDQIIEGSNNRAGAVRILTIKGGGTIKEKLLSIDDSEHTFKYTILESPLPVSSYTSTFTVKPSGEGRCEVTWSGEFKRKNIGDNPADNENDKSAIDAISGVYQTGLDNLKKIVEGK
jgi:mxaD protein